jgi:uncharacterized phage-associated protein
MGDYLPLLIDHKRDKLLEAIAFFVASTKHCGLVKTFKLLYWLDYHHFRETGRDVTGLTYFAYRWGPVPKLLHDQFSQKRGDIASQFDIEDGYVKSAEYTPPTIDSEPTGSEVAGPAKVPTRIKPKFKYRHYYLTRREQRIAETLADIFREVGAADISDISHIKGGPWSKALKEGGDKAPIQFLSALVPMQKGEYLNEEDLRREIAEHEMEQRVLA